MYYFWMLLKIIFYIPYRLVFPTRVINRKELKKHRGKGIVLVCNHKSNGDPPLMIFLFNRKLNFPVKESLMRDGISRWFFRTLGCFPVKKGNDVALMRHFLDRLAHKQAVFVFPEGRRVFNSEEALTLHNGAAMIAIKGGVPIVPMVIKRAPRLFVPNAIKIGSTIQTGEYQNKRLEKSDLNELSGKIRDSMAELLINFEHKPKPKLWEKEVSVISRGIVFINENTENTSEVTANAGAGKSKLLVIKRNKNGQEYYVLPGGHIENGESARDAVAREVLEETNIVCEPERLLYKYKLPALPDANPRAAGMQSFYLCNYKRGKAGATDAEEYTDKSRTSGTYEPMLVDTAALKSMDLRPKVIKEQLIRDIKKFGIKLTRAAKYVK